MRNVYDDFDEFDDSEDTSPTTVGKDVALPLDLPTVELTYVDANSTDDEVINADAKTSFLVLNALHQAWGRPMTIKDLCGLATTTMRTLEVRRKLLNKQYGNNSASNIDSQVFSLD